MAKHLTLTRYPYEFDEKGTFGKMFIGDRVFYSVERPWLDNQPSVSCVPEGEYELQWLPTTTLVPAEFHEMTWYLDGETVSAAYHSHKPRTRCALHIANFPRNVRGCIGFGRQLGSDVWSGEQAVLASRHAMRDLIELLGPNDLTLKIVRRA